MNKNELIAKATRSFYKINFKLKKHSPELLVGAGIVGVVTSAVMACKATTKVQHILNNDLYLFFIFILLQTFLVNSPAL